MRWFRAVFPAALLALATAAMAAPEPAVDRTPAVTRWESLGYGMFIHFGMATFTRDELGKIASPLEAYRPAKLDVDQWICAARDAGMRYAVLTTKHCTGHCLWPSKLTDYTVAHSPVTTDVVGEFVRACRRHGIRPGFYYLLGWDSHHQPKMTPTEYERFCTGQIEELLTGYGSIAELWLDIPFDMGPDTAGALRRIYERAKALQPDCMVMLNQGFTDGAAVSTIAPTYNWQPTGAQPVPMWPRDIIGGERTLPPASGHDPWMAFQGAKRYIPMEVCDTIGRDWFWHEDDALRSTENLLALYRACRERHANLLLDVPPDASGRIPEPTVRRLRDLAAAIRQGREPKRSLLTGRPARASNTYHGDATYGPDRAIDGDEGTRWATDDDAHEAWLEVDLGGPVTFSRAFVSEGWNRVRSFAIEVPDGRGAWRAVYEGRKIGSAGVEARFRTVTAAMVRLHVREATVGPTIWDFDLYE